MATSSSSVVLLCLFLLMITLSGTTLALDDKCEFKERSAIGVPPPGIFHEITNPNYDDFLVDLAKFAIEEANKCYTVFWKFNNITSCSSEDIPVFVGLIGTHYKIIINTLFEGKDRDYRADVLWVNPLKEKILMYFHANQFLQT